MNFCKIFDRSYSKSEMSRFICQHLSAGIPTNRTLIFELFLNLCTALVEYFTTFFWIIFQNMLLLQHPNVSIMETQYYVSFITQSSKNG